MKFITYLENISGVGIYPMISLILFFIFFIVVTYFVFKTDQSLIEEYENIPFNDSNQ